MSLGFEVDLLAVLGLVNQASYTELSPTQSQEYQSVVTSCERLLERLKNVLEKYSSTAEVGKTGKTAIKRIWKRLKWEPDDIRDIRSQISIKLTILKSLNDQVINHSLVKLVQHHEDTEREAILKWVSDINYVAQQNDIVNRCQIGSRRWLFESEVYLEWCKQKGGLLFCPGNAGTGKTFTTAMVVESLQLENNAETLTTYMFCTYQNHTQTMEKLLCSLLRVALEEAKHEASRIVSTCKQLRSSNKILSRLRCLELLKDLFSGFMRVNLIVDALDELSNEVRRPLIYDLLKLHEHGNVSLFVTSRGIPEIQHKFEGCKKYTSLEVRSSDEDIRNFLRDNLLRLPSFVARSQPLQDEVINSITNASAGMFLLAELYLKSLAGMISVGSLRTRLSNLATGSSAYDTLYEESMLRIGFQGPESERIALQMLLVLTCARRPLSPLELSHALSIDEISDAFDEDMVPDMDDLVAACTGLVVLDDTSNIVHLVHKSAAEYFERTRSRWFPRANERMAIMCLRYLHVVKTVLEGTRGEEAPFFHYAKANWSYHSMEGEKEAVSEDASRSDSVTNHISSPSKLPFAQLAIQQMTREVVDMHSSIVDACHAGHQAGVEQLLVVRNYDMNDYRYGKLMEQKALIGDTTFKDETLLTIAATRRDYSMTLLLLARGADPNIFNSNGENPISIKPDLMCWHSGGLFTAFLASVSFGQQGCFRMLLEISDRGTRDSCKRGAIIIPELLKWPDVEIDYADAGFCGSPLGAAIKGNQEEATILLLPYTRCQPCSDCGITPIHYAVQEGFHDLLERLLKHDASTVDYELDVDVHYRSRSMRIHSPPLESIWESRFPSIGCEWNGSKQTKTPLITAISLQDVQATQLLLPYANVNQGLSWRPLHEAAQQGNVEIFELLLKIANIELDPVDEDGRTPFLLAAERGNCDVMNALIKQGGVQFDRRDAEGYAAVDYIIHPNLYKLEYFRILASIVDIDVNEKDSTGFNLLHKACGLHPDFRIAGNQILEVELLKTNSAPLVSELLKRPNVDVNLFDREGNTPLLLAVKNCQRDVVGLLLNRKDTDVLAKNKRGQNALFFASSYELMFSLYSTRVSREPSGVLVPPRYKVGGWPKVLLEDFKEYSESIFSMLMHDERTKMNRRNKEGESIMAGVTKSGTKRMVQAVLETSELASDPEIICPDGQNLLCLALQKNEDDDAVDLLIAHCPVVALQKADAQGRTPLSYAVKRATSRATRLLLAAEVDINVVDQYGRTPLYYAIDNGNPDAACLLIAVDETQIKIPDNYGRMPLMLAAKYRNIPILFAFLERSDVDMLALDSKGHSFLCYLMRSDIIMFRSAEEVDSILQRIHHLLQFRLRDLKACNHSPFICALHRARDAAQHIQHYAILSEYFHPGLDFSRCSTKSGLLEALGGVYDLQV
ncbi:ankyrin repeat-containing domain protein [Trichoderma barbatum]